MSEYPSSDHQVVLYPNDGLQTPCATVEEGEFGPDLELLGNEMIGLTLKHEGYGLAAPQIGLSKRIFVMHYANGGATPFPPVTLCNPEIVNAYSEGTFSDESCLSLPGVGGKVFRSEEIQVAYRTPLGEPREMVLLGLEARIAQHEIDHLDGILFFQRMNRDARKRVLKDFEKARRKKFSSECSSRPGVWRL